MRSALIRLGDAIAQFCLLFAAAALFVIVVINGINVVARYVFAAPFAWAEEAMLHIMIAGVFAGAVSVAWQRRHIRIDAFVNLLAPRGRAAVDYLSTAVAIVVLVVLGIVSARVASLLFAFDQRSDALHLPMWIPHGAVALAIFVIVLMPVVRLLAERGDGSTGVDDDRRQDRSR